MCDNLPHLDLPRTLRDVRHALNAGYWYDSFVTCGGRLLRSFPAVQRSLILTKSTNAINDLAPKGST